MALVALKNGYYGKTGLFALFAMTVTVVAIVILTFVRWVDRIARLGRIGSTVEKVEAAGAGALAERQRNPRLGGARYTGSEDEGTAIHSNEIGYVQHVNLETLQELATRLDCRIGVKVLPGTFTSPDRPVACVLADAPSLDDGERTRIAEAFDIGRERVYDDDPRFALIALSEIASRALSPAVNDPGTAISILGSHVRLFRVFVEADRADGPDRRIYDRVLVPDLDIADMLDDAFRAIARDGAGIVEVQVRLQKSLRAIAALSHEQLADAARSHARAALSRAERELVHDADRDAVLRASDWINEPAS